MLTVGGNHLKPITTPLKPALVSCAEDYVKVRLYYFTSTPKHIRSLQLAQHHCQPPFPEDICILMPRMKVFDLLETFMPAFETLRNTNAIPGDAQLQNFQILVEDILTLAYKF